MYIYAILRYQKYIPTAAPYRHLHHHKSFRSLFHHGLKGSMSAAPCLNFKSDPWCYLNVRKKSVYIYIYIYTQWGEMNIRKYKKYFFFQI